MAFDQWLGFASIALIATLSPGPAILLVTSHALCHGVRKSLATMLGNISGLFLMSLASVLGLSSLLTVSVVAFTAVKLIGAGYLIYLGIKLWRHGLSPVKQTEKQGQPKKTGVQLYLQGVFIALTNPKALAFVTALFPQFVDLKHPVIPQFLLLVSTFMALSFTCLLGYALLAKRGQLQARQSQRFRALRQASGKIMGSGFIGAGLLLASAQQR